MHNKGNQSWMGDNCYVVLHILHVKGPHKYRWGPGMRARG